MRRITIIFVLLCYCFSSAAAIQLVKIPLLINHFNKHKTLNSQLTFSSFIYQHYVLSDDGDNDDSEDQKLPFKSESNQKSTSDYFPLIKNRQAFNNFCTNKPIATPWNVNVPRFAFDNSVWQPPKQ